MIEALLLVLSLLLVVACGLFVAAEFAFVTVDRPSVERAAASGDRQAGQVAGALRMLSTQLSGAQLGITVTNLVIGFLAEPAIAALLEGPLRAIGLPAGAVPSIAVILGLAAATAVTMVYGELVPKNLAIADPMGTARAVAPIQRAFTRATSWVIRLLNGAANLLLRPLGVQPQEELASARSPEELASLVRRSQEQGTLPSDTATLLRRSLAFGDKRAGDVRTPRTQMLAIGADAPAAEVLALARTTGHSRFPVRGEDIDDIVGLVHIKHAVGVSAGNRAHVTVRQVMIPPVQVPDSMDLDTLLETLRSGGLQMAVVVDEFGGTDGVVTVEDLIEELVGEVVDEHDAADVTAYRRRDGSWLLSGLLRPDEVAEHTGVTLPRSEAYETLGGLLAAALGRVPTWGDRVTLDGHRLTVERMDGRRVARVRLELP